MKARHANEKAKEGHTLLNFRAFLRDIYHRFPFKIIDASNDKLFSIAEKERIFRHPRLRFSIVYFWSARILPNIAG